MSAGELGIGCALDRTDVVDLTGCCGRRLCVWSIFFEGGTIDGHKGDVSVAIGKGGEKREKEDQAQAQAVVPTIHGQQ